MSIFVCELNSDRYREVDRVDPHACLALYIHTCMHAYIQTYVHICLQTYMHGVSLDIQISVLQEFL